MTGRPRAGRFRGGIPAQVSSVCVISAVVRAILLIIVVDKGATPFAKSETRRSENNIFVCNAFVGTVFVSRTCN